MGFYGNITNTSRTTFQFDKIYPNRYSMEKNTNTDEVFIGRYVLIEYDSTGTTDDLPRVYFGPDDNGYLYTDSTLQHPVIYTEDLANISTSTGYVTARVANTTTGPTYKYYTANPVAVGDPLVFELDSASIYSHNFDIDENYALETGISIGRGWDSTVWQKVFLDGQQKYINIAELNTIVPTFGITVDAPSDNPAAPHFGERSSNIYYDLHISPPWGFRVKEATTGTRMSNTTINNYVYYDSSTEQFRTKITNGDIYFNKEAFDPQLNAATIIKHSPNITDNSISISNGYTNKFYNNHSTANPVDTSRQEDVKELSIHLPIIGDIISDVWDLIYGVNRDSTTGDAGNGSIVGRLNSFSAIPANQIPVKRASDGTLVGTKINGDTHYAIDGPAILNDYTSTGFNSDDAWIYTKIDSAAIINNNNNNAIQIHHTFHAEPDTFSTSDKNGNITQNGGFNNNTDDVLRLYTPIVDVMGHVVGKNIESVTLPYGYKTITATNSTVDAAYAEPLNAVTNDIIADNTQDILSVVAGNKWVRLATDAVNDKLTIAHETHVMDTVAASNTNINDHGDTITIQDISFDAAGHMTANKNHTYILPYGYKQFTIDAASTATTNPVAAEFNIIADNTQDIMTISPTNKWIRLSGETDSIKIGHQVNTFESGSPNTKYGLVSDESIATLDVDNTFEVPVIKADEAGHVTFLETHTVALPENFNKITITTSNETANSLAGLTGDIEPDSLIDTLTLAEGNQWINIEADSTNDKITFKHYVKLVTPTDSTATLSNETSTDVTFPVPTYTFDNAGHITALDTKTYTMPFGYGKIIGDSGNTSASATYDTFSITGDTWVTTSVSTDAVALAHSAPHNTAHTSVSNETPNFGSTFTITDWDFDTKGHKANSGTHTVTIPQGSLTDATASGNDVITQLAFTPSTGALSTTRTNITALKLANYNNTALNGQQTIASTDTLGQALQKTQTNIDLLEAAISQEITDRDNAITSAVNSIINGAPAALDTLKEIADWIDEEPTGAAAMAGRIGSLETAVNLINGTSSQNGSIAYAIDQEVTNRNNAISAVITNYQTKPTSGNFITDTQEFDVNGTNMTISALISYIISLENRIAYLETFHPAPTEPDPEPEG